MSKDLQEKGTSHLVLTPFECRTAVIFQALIPTLNASQASGGINFVNIDRGICVASNAMSIISSTN
jgi:hypothetical protein